MPARTAPQERRGPPDWRPTADERRAIRAAARALHLWDDWAWRADLEQAALFELWVSAEKRKGYTGRPFAIAFGFARNAMKQEWRRITERTAGSKRVPGEPVQFAALDDCYALADETRLLPEEAAHRSACLRRVDKLPGALARAVHARLEHDSMREAAAALGLASACFQTRLYRAQRALEDLHEGRPVNWRELSV